MRLLTPALAALLLSFTISATVPAIAAGDPPPAAAEEKKEEKKGEKKRSSEWMEKYGKAVALVKSDKFEDAIVILAAMNDGENDAGVQNYLGFTNRKLKRMDVAKKHYEAALKIDPEHRGALEYYGEWHVETGDIAGARALLVRLEKACGNKTCEEYSDLAKAIDDREKMNAVKKS